MGSISKTPYPRNAPGDFYVEDGCCITCEAPYHEAPDLMAHDAGNFHHCYFKRQPETPEEVERAVMACRVSCVKAVRYAGSDPKILERFRELRSADSCDVLTSERPGGRHPSGDGASLTLKEKLEIAREIAGRLGKSERKPPPTSGPHPLFDRELDG